jgi:hypothetical protein
VAKDLAQKESAAFRSIKNLIRAPVAEEMSRREKDSIREFVCIWYSENTWKKVRMIRITS